MSVLSDEQLYRVYREVQFLESHLCCDEDKLHIKCLRAVAEAAIAAERAARAEPLTTLYRWTSKHEAIPMLTDSPPEIGRDTDSFVEVPVYTAPPVVPDAELYKPFTSEYEQGCVDGWNNCRDAVLAATRADAATAAYEAKRIGSLG